MKIVQYLLLCLVALLAHSTIMKLFTIGFIRPDLMLLVLIYISLKEGSFAGIWTGFCIGLLQDAYMPSALGVNAFTKALIGFMAGFLNEHEWRTDVWIRAIVLVLAFFIHDFIAYVLRTGTSDGIWWSLLTFTLPSAVYTLAIWGGLWFFIRRKGQAL